MADARLRLSSFAVVLPLGGDRAFVGHAIQGRTLICDGAVGRVVQSLGSPQTLSELERGLAHHELFADSPARVAEIVADLRARGIVTGSSPEHELEQALRTVESAHGVRQRMRQQFAPAEQMASPPAKLRLRAVVLGWCTAEALVPALRAEGRARGVEIEVRTGFEDDAELAREHQADFCVLALGNVRVLGPLFAADGADAVAVALAECERLIRAAAEATPGTLLVQGLVAPQTEPLGLAAARSEDSVADRIFELNRGIRRVVRTLPAAVYLDLERQFSSAGKARLLDDRVAPWSHAGVAGGASNPEYHEIVASVCWNALEAACGRAAIRCVAVDLDGVLWPGEIADPSFSFEDDECSTSLLYGLHGGIHEALRALRARGIVLGVVSRNVHESVLEKWREMRDGTLGAANHLLSPEDFACLKIGWTEKSQSLSELCQELGIASAALAFIDDSPLERAEVQSALPDVWVLEEPPERMRETLLTSHRFELLAASLEARNRAETTRARVLRDGELARSANRAEFLRGLDVRCTLRTAREPHELDRVCELIFRTNQFRTTAERISRRELDAMSNAPGASISTMAVSDRFGNYGVVGAALIEDSELRLLTLSCRVIGADVHAVLFRAALERCRKAAPGRPVLVRWEQTLHNAPAKRLFEATRWQKHDGGYVLLPSEPLPHAPAHCAVSYA